MQLEISSAIENDRLMQYIVLIALIVGLLMYLLCANTKAVEIGRILFMAACIGICIAASPATVHLIQH